jgi:uncharacterized RDD family membrane protein YckC
VANGKVGTPGDESGTEGTRRTSSRIVAVLLGLIGAYCGIYAIVDAITGGDGHGIDFWSAFAVVLILSAAALAAARRLWAGFGNAWTQLLGLRRVRADAAGPGDPNVVLRRVWAQLVDLAAYAVALAAIKAFGPYVFHSAWIVSAGAAYVWIPLFATANWVVFQGLTGYSLGKWVLRIRVVDQYGEAPGLWRALVRTLPLVIEQYGIVAIWAMRRSHARQRFGDRWAGTLVIRARQQAAPRTTRFALTE